MPARGWGGHSRAALVGLVVVLLAWTGLGLWSAQSNSRAARLAVAASRLSDDYAQMSTALTAEESLERKYRLEPGPEIRARFNQSAADLLAAAELVQQDGHAQERTNVEQVAAAHASYLQAVYVMFAAVDRSDTREVLRIDGAEVDPRFGAILAIVDEQVKDHHEHALRTLADLQTLESSSALATPLVFLVGLVLIGFFFSVLRGVHRELDRQREKVVYDARHDSLTGLPNRTQLGARCGEVLRAGRAAGSATGLLVLDLDRFKEVNNTLGHTYGDRLLIEIGRRLADAAREVDTVARLGGDKFAVLLPGIDGVDAAIVVADKLLDALAQPFQIDDVLLDVQASIGVVISGEHGDDVMTLVQRADIAMYLAKEQGIGVLVYDAKIDEHSPERLALLGQLGHGLQSSELTLHYQPKVCLSTGEACGVEALVRWQHPERGLISPDQFVPLAERTGLIGPLTFYVLDTALAQVRAWTDAGYLIPVAVNLSARNLLDEHLPDQVAALLIKHDVPARMLNLEVTESAIITEPARAERLLRRLQALGVSIAIDDFGTGYTSLAELKKLPVNEIKVDRSFVTSMVTDSCNALIVQSVVDIAHNLGFLAIAEGVESREVMVALGRLGYDIAQGYYFSRPLPADDLLAWYVQAATVSHTATPVRLYRVGHQAARAGS